MKTPFRVALASAALLAAAVPVSALAQNAPGAGRPAATAPLPHKVGLLDMGHIFTSYQKVKDQREALQKEFEAASGDVQNIQKQMKDIEKQLTAGTITKGSEQWTALEQQYTELKAQGQAKASNLQREFVRKEVAIYKEAHEEVSKYVTYYANTFKYTLILRYSRDPQDTEAAEDPNAVMNRINQLVVYHQPADDVTDQLLKALNDNYAKQTGRTASAAPAGDDGAASAVPKRR